MANEIIQFKKGLAANLPSTKTAGQVLVETDTGNMYIDDSSDSRIQIKDSTKISSITAVGQTLTCENGNGAINTINTSEAIKLTTENLDNVKTEGVYWWSSANGTLAGTGGLEGLTAFNLEVIRTGSGNYMQLLTTSSAKKLQYRRWVNGSTWGDWIENNINSTVTPIDKGGTGATAKGDAYRALAMEYVKTSNTSCNDFTSPGWYYFTSTYPITDPPGTMPGYLYVVSAVDSTVNQFWFNKAMTVAKKRIYQNSAWGEWSDFKPISNATTSASGLMSDTDKSRIDTLYSHTGNYGVTAGTNAAYTVTIDGTTLTHGTVIFVRFNVANAKNATLNVNSLGAKPIYYKNAAITASIIPAQTAVALVYDTDLVSTGVWRLIYSYNANTTYSAMTAATDSAAGKAGLVPAPAAGNNTSFLRGDATWVDTIPIANGGTGATTQSSALFNLIYKNFTAGTDLNTLINKEDLGLYYLGSAANPVNAPVNTTGYLIVVGESGILRKQIWLTQGNTNNHYNIYIRTYNGTTWMDWEQINSLPSDKAKLDSLNISVDNKSLAFGESNSVQNVLKSYVYGDYNTINGVRDVLIIGEDNNCTTTDTDKISMYGSVVIGYSCNITAGNQALFGFGLNGTNQSQLICGVMNDTNSSGTFIIGNGTNNSRSNAFRVTAGGITYANGAYNTSGADYAEFIKEWYDGNPNNEDRVGYMVTIKNGKLHKANEGDYIIGITSGNPSIVGNADECYYWKYERDEFNRIILDEEGKPKISENYDSSKEYIERAKRPEWDYVGMRGVVPCRDDGTCEEGGFCKCGVNGIATKADTRGFDTYYVIERISENVIAIEVK